MYHFQARHFRARHFLAVHLPEQVPITGYEPAPYYLRRTPLVKTLELPLPPAITEILGIHQSDVIIKSALELALADMRANPGLLDYAFASLPQDAITARDYGDKERQAAKDWFLKTAIGVAVVPYLNEAQWPVISIEMVDSVEAVNEASLGDVHHLPWEGTDTSWPALNREPIVVTSYIPATGKIKIRDEVEFSIAPGMYIIDQSGTEHEILDVISNTEFKISPQTVANLAKVSIKSRRPAFQTSVESSSFKETFRIGIHVQGEAAFLTWLHSVVVFAIMRYKQVLMEARGFERTTVQSTQLARDERFEAENVFSRFLTISGFVRQYWPKTVAPVLDAVEFDKLMVSGQDADVSVEDAGLEPASQLWVGNKDQ
jgi:hypothetical protein